jgi:hypothetical protein
MTARQSTLATATHATLSQSSQVSTTQECLHGCLELVGLQHASRDSLQHFIQTGFDKHYGAAVAHFMPHLAGVHRHGAWQAVLGLRFAGSEPLFIEQYLDAPIEQVLAARGLSATRQDIAEIGHLFAESRPALMQLFLLIAQGLHQLKMSTLVFTATRDVRVLLKRHGIELLPLSPADPARLGDKAAAWGRYYDTCPEVCVMSLGDTAAQIQQEPRLLNVIFRHWPQLHSLVDTLKESVQ